MDSDNPLEQPLRYLPGVGPNRAALLKRLGLETVDDLGATLGDVKRDGCELVRDLERHVNTEETQLSGFL